MNHSINSQTCLSKLERTVQDHYQTLEKTYKKQKRKEDRQSGINPEETEVDIALADIIERFEEAQKYTKTPVKSRRKKQSKTQQKQKTCEESH